MKQELLHSERRLQIGAWLPRAASPRRSVTGPAGFQLVAPWRSISVDRRQVTGPGYESAIALQTRFAHPGERS
ncbi:MAG: hypothetical protein CMJ59_11255 [Planctomycetaceae bacterium]|nr:hypothetical protein [Planctomycetaceae bacterium]